MNVLIEETAAVKSKLSVEQERLKVLNRIQKDLMSHIERIVLNLEIRDDQPLEVYRKKLLMQQKNSGRYISVFVK